MRVHLLGDLAVEEFAKQLLLVGASVCGGTFKKKECRWAPRLTLVSSYQGNCMNNSKSRRNTSVETTTELEALEINDELKDLKDILKSLMQGNISMKYFCQSYNFQCVMRKIFKATPGQESFDCSRSEEEQIIEGKTLVKAPRAVPGDVEQFLLIVNKIGGKERLRFMDECRKNATRFKNIITRQKIVTFATTGKNKLQGVSGKVVAVCMVVIYLGASCTVH
ncbi:hypothetical protein GQR58_020755 [Nymphon striatum]|nr:hypothetical protein GQR58_020755 [Nymphon striatum]